MVKFTKKVFQKLLNLLTVDYIRSYRPKADNDKLILVASLNLSPVAPVFPWRSLPAKSTKFNFPARI